MLNKIAHMFDSLVTATTGTHGAAAVTSWARVENAGCARRLAAMVTMLDTAYAASGSADRDYWYLDNWGAVSAHIGAAQSLTQGAASGQLMVAVALRDRLPQVAQVFWEGLITYAVVRTIVSRTMLVKDADALHALDSSLAAALRDWEPMSKDRTEQTIDAFVEQVDPLAVRRRETKAKSRGVELTVDDGDGTAELLAVLFTHDAVAVYDRLNALADTVCPGDPRTKDQRRADALGAVAAGADRLGCLCDEPDCPAGELPPSTGVVVYVIAHEDTLADPPAPAAPADPTPPDGPAPDDPPAPELDAAPKDHVAEPPSSIDDASSSNITPDSPAGPGGLTPPGDLGADDGHGPEPDAAPKDEVAEQPSTHDDASESGVTPDSAAPDTPADSAARAFYAECTGLDGVAPPLFGKPLRDVTIRELLNLGDDGRRSVIRPGALMGGRFLPGAVTRRAALNAKLVAIVHPGQAPPEPRYRPSKKLADFVRCRDLTCRFPGCTAPATNCDLDHTIPWPYGPTQASNLKCLCRRHHLLKTHWGGPSGWRDRQLPEGTVEWTAPDGRVYRTTPGSRLLFPELCAPTAPTRVNPADVPAARTTGLTMPKRRTTRDDDRAQRIERERALNRLLAEGEGGARAAGGEVVAPEAVAPDDSGDDVERVRPPF